MAHQFSTDNAATVKRWSTKDTRDSEKSMWWYPLMFADGRKGEKAEKSGMVPESKWKGIVRYYTEFTEHESGDRITVPHVPKVTGRGVHGDGLLRGSGAAGNLLTQDLLLDFFAHQIYSAGPLSDQRAVLKFMDAWRPEMTKWHSRKWEEAIVLSLWGLTTWYGSPLENFNAGGVGEANVLNSPIETFDAEAISYAGDATSAGTVDSGDVLTAAVLTKLRTQIREDRTYPVEPILDAKGKPCWLFVTSGRGIEQLKADSTFREAHTRVIKDSDNPLTQRAEYYFDGFYIAEYEKCLRVSQNVGRSLVLGADALLMAKHKGIEYFVDPADDAQRREALSVTGSGALKANKVDSKRRNAHALDHYVRT